LVGVLTGGLSGCCSKVSSGEDEIPTLDDGFVFRGAWFDELSVAALSELDDWSVWIFGSDFVVQPVGILSRV
jgi:hypothetical protein